MSRALLFSGQGSQYVGMAKDLYAESEAARSLIQQADEKLGFAISDICFHGPEDSLRQTRYTQPALFVHEMAIMAELGGRLSFNAVAGHSLGEYSALCAAGVLSFTDALTLVALRGALMFTAGEKQPGAMAAIIGLSDEKVEELCASMSGGTIVPANYNSPGQLVISGDAEYLRAQLPAFKEAGARMVTELPVSGAFHSPLMQPAKEELASAIHQTQFQDATVDVYCNVSGSIERNAEALKANLIAQLVSPVRWTQTLLKMKEQGITEYVEIGPKNVLQGLVKRTLSEVVIKGFDTLVQIQALKTE